jgi:S-DNA-T family DNA segregation ATPase FtsK/SpoIIIE
MLFKTADGILLRAQGAWISDDEIGRITSFIEEHSSIQYDENFTKKLGRIKETSLEDDDEEDGESKSENAAAEREKIKSDAADNDFKKAIKCIIETKRASISHFQRRLKWGYNHSASIIDMLEDAGVVSPQAGAGPRQIVMSEEELLALCSQDEAGGEGGGAGTEDDTETLFTTEEQI